MIRRRIRHLFMEKLPKQFRTSFATLLLLLSFFIGSYLTYLMLFNQQVVAIFNTDKLNLVIEDQLVPEAEEIKETNNEILISLNLIKKYIDGDILYDEASSTIIITQKESVLRLKIESNQAYVNSKIVNISVSPKKEGEIIFLPLKFLSAYYDLDFQKQTETNAIVIDFKNKSNSEWAKIITKEALIRMEPSIRSPIVFNAGENVPIRVRLYDRQADADWVRVRTDAGYMGYITQNNLEIMTSNQLEAKLQKINTTIQGKVVLLWDMVYSKRYDFSKDKKIQGLDVVSPTWFQIANENGAIISRAYKEYMHWAHGNGYQVWALFANDFNAPTATGKALASAKTREVMIKQLLEKIDVYGIDGLNIDFEMVSKKDRANALQFIKEITPLLRERGCVVSVDIAVPEGYDTTYDAQGVKTLGSLVDFVIMMGYDQHWSGSSVAGSVAQISWVESNLKKLISYQVPKEKILLGVPFYTRLWEETKDKNGKVILSGKSILTMNGAKRVLNQNNAKATWDEKSGQFYADFTKGNIRYKIWLEDENSIDLRSSLILKYDIGGIAAWSKGSEVPNVWTKIYKNLKELKTYDAWNFEHTGYEMNLNQ